VNSVKRYIQAVSTSNLASGEVFVVSRPELNFAVILERNGAVAIEFEFVERVLRSGSELVTSRSIGSMNEAVVFWANNYFPIIQNR